MWNTSKNSFFWIHILCSTYLEICTAYRVPRHFLRRRFSSLLHIAQVNSVGSMESVVPLRKLRVAEFFSGIGGWSSALSLQNNLEFTVVAAYDVNIVSNVVYKHLHGHTPSSTSIESLSVKTLEALGADMWVMSPPCQPYTRQHPATENDPRSNALLHLIKSITKLKNPPRYLALENVIGFEESPACKTLLDTLEGMGYNFRQFALSPTQFGVPNERPRYYLLAVLHGEFSISGPDKSLSSVTGQLRNSCSGQPESVTTSVGIISDETSTSIHSSTVIAVDGSMDTLSGSAPSEESSILNVRTVRASIPGLSSTPPRPLKSYLADSLPLADIERLLVPAKSLEKNASWCLDIVTPNDTHTSCFTKSYSKYFKGTGSVLLIPDPYPVIDQKGATVSIESSFSSSSSMMQESNSDAAVNDISNNAQPAVAVAAAVGAAGADGVSQADTSTFFVRSDLAANGAASSDFRESPETRTFDLNWKDKLNGNKLRFFSPDELLRLFGFLPFRNTRNNLKRSIADFEENSDVPKECSVDNVVQLSKSSFFPENIANVNCYQMIGNSLSVTVVSHLLHHMLSCTFTKATS